MTKTDQKSKGRVYIERGTVRLFLSTRSLKNLEHRQHTLISPCSSQQQPWLLKSPWVSSSRFDSRLFPTYGLRVLGAVLIELGDSVRGMNVASFRLSAPAAKGHSNCCCGGSSSRPPSGSTLLDEYLPESAGCCTLCTLCVELSHGVVLWSLGRKQTCVLNALSLRTALCRLLMPGGPWLTLS